MKTCLVNLYDLDPPRNGGMSRITFLVSHLLAEYADLGCAKVFFAVGWRYSSQFREWLGHSGGTLVPVLYEVDQTPLLDLIKPDITINPLFGMFPIINSKAYAGMVNIASMPDALALDMPHLFSKTELYNRRYIYNQLKQSDLVVTISDHARGRLIFHLGLKEDQVTVVPLAGNGLELTTPSFNSQPHFHISSPYILYPANGWPHKRHEFLLRIMNCIWIKRPDISLVLTGWRPAGYIAELASHLGCPTDKIIDLGYVNGADEMVSLYRNAEAMLFVSEYEGFCMPALEAMTNECPVICAPVASIPEVAGNAALYVNSNDPADWAFAFLDNLPTRRVELIEKGKIKAAEYSWEKTKQKWADIFLRLGLDPSGDKKGFSQSFNISEAIVSSELQIWSGQLAIFEQELEEKEKKEKTLDSVRNELIAKEAVIQSFQRSLFFWLVNGPFGRFIPFRSFLIKLGIRGRFRPKLGVFVQYPPRSLKIPVRYRQEARLPEDELPVISMVTPSFNQAVFLGRTIQSILSQEYPRLEYVLQDGNSTDGSADVLEKYRSQLTHVESVRDGGQAHAINLGFRHTTGQIMAYMNSDDMLLPGTLHYVARYFARHPQVDVVYGHRIIVDENDQEVGVWVLPPHDGNMLEWGDYVPQETMFWRREIWDKSGGKMDESFKFALDWDLLNRFQQAGARIVRLPRFLAVFRVHGAQKSTAQIHDLGLREMNQLRQQIHGRKVQPDEINSNLRLYLMRSVIYHQLYRLGILRY